METTTHILIVGAGLRGTSLLEALRDDTMVTVLGVVDSDSGARGLSLAKRSGIAVSDTWEEFIRDTRLDEVINCTGSPEVFAALTKAAPQGVRVIREPAEVIMRLLIDKKGRSEKLLRDAEEELEAQAWGLRKTNEAIKQLYKELEQKNRELKKIDEMKSEFVAMVSHELRTPLSIIKHGVGMLLGGISGEINEQQREVLTIATHNIERLTRIINDLLDLAKIEAGKITVRKKDISLEQVVRHVVDSFRAKAEERGIAVKMCYPAEERTVCADADRITQVLTNLVGNALQFIEQGHITLSVEFKSDEAWITVADTGPGIDAEHIARVFDKFHQAGREPGPGEKGTGLGLSIARGIVQLHGGRIWAESVPGQGSRFTFSLPYTCGAADKDQTDEDIT